MNSKRFGLYGSSLLSLILAVAAVGCDATPANTPSVVEPQAHAATPAPKAEKKAEVKTVPITPNIVLEIEGKKRRVLLATSVCLQRGPLEQLLTRQDTKEHEAILSADIDVRDLHKALLLSGARAGSPVQFDPKYRPASGQTIKITCQYQQKGKTITVNAQEWVRDVNTKKPLRHEWVFSGSRLVSNPLAPNELIFLANDGDVVCVSNFESALLDLPILSSETNADLAFEANPERIPPVGTKVTVIFEPVPEKK